MNAFNKPEEADEPLPTLSDIADGVSFWTGRDLDRAHQYISSDAVAKLKRTINILGKRSQRAQGINAPLTTITRLHESPTNRLYFLVHNQRGIGILKLGVKKLFLVHPKRLQGDKLVETDALCVLDFYVDDSVQRKGFGKHLFEFMLERERVRPEWLAIDRPSPKFTNFLKKHYRLDQHTLQTNNFLVYHRFFDETKITEKGKLIRINPAASSPAMANDAEKRPSYTDSTHNYSLRESSVHCNTFHNTNNYNNNNNNNNYRNTQRLSETRGVVGLPKTVPSGPIVSPCSALSGHTKPRSPVKPSLLPSGANKLNSSFDHSTSSYAEQYANYLAKQEEEKRKREAYQMHLREQQTKMQHGRNSQMLPNSGYHTKGDNSLRPAQGVTTSGSNYNIINGLPS